MKKTLNIAATALLILLTFSFSQCKKEVVGPTGPQGATGAQGQQGPAGSVDVTTKTITTTSWQFINNYHESMFTLSEINQDILNSGVVMVYFIDGSFLQQLPYTYYPTSSYSRTINFKYFLLGLKVTITDSDLLASNPSGTWNFKLVIIPGSVKISGVNHSNYTEVKNAYHLSD